MGAGHELTTTGRDPSRLRPLGILGIGLLQLAAWAVLWWSVPDSVRGHADFRAPFGAATAMTRGQAGSMYDVGVTGPIQREVTGPSTGGSYEPFEWLPVSAVPVLPLVPLGYYGAFAVWAAIQILLVIAGVVLVAGSTREQSMPRLTRAAVVAAAVAAPGIFNLAYEGQVDGILVLGLAATWALWRRERWLGGAVVLGFAAAVSKPHLLIAVIGLCLGWRNLRVIAGGLIGVAAAVVVSLPFGGASALRGFVDIIVANAHEGSALHVMVGVAGVIGSYLGDTPLAGWLVLAGTAIAFVAGVVLGDRLRRGQVQLASAFSLAIVFSLLGSPHVLPQDLVLLAVPLAVAYTTRAAARPQLWPDRPALTLVLVAAVLAVTDVYGQFLELPAPPGNLTPWALILFTFALARALPARAARAPVPAQIAS